MAGKLKPGSVGVLATVDESSGKVFLACAVTDDLVTSKKLNAGRIVGSLAKIVGGGGGGRPNFATAGGKQPDKLQDALRHFPILVGEMLS